MKLALFLAAGMLLRSQTVIPAAVTLSAGQTQQFTSNLLHCSWTTPLGTVTPAGVYQAPSAIPFTMFSVVTCTSGTTVASASISLTTSFTAAGVVYARGGGAAGTTFNLGVTAPIYAARNTLFLDYDPVVFKTVPDPAQAGQVMLTAASGYRTITTGAIPGVQPGITLPQRPTLNLLSGSGVVVSCADNPAIQATDCTFDVNTAVIQSILQAQSGAAQFCISSNGSSTALQCSLAVAISSYNPGMMVLLVSSTATSGTPTLQINEIQPPVALMRSDCKTSAGTDLPSVQPMLFWYNGTFFCEIAGGH